jgi:hypothetical protein
MSVSSAMVWGVSIGTFGRLGGGGGVGWRGEGRWEEEASAKIALLSSDSQTHPVDVDTVFP